MIGNGTIKTNHFLVRQNERNVPQKLVDHLAHRIVRCKRKTIVIISRKILRQYGISKNKDLFVVADGPILITCYYRDFQEFVLTSGKQIEYLIINDLKK